MGFDRYRVPSGTGAALYRAARPKNFHDSTKNLFVAIQNEKEADTTRLN